MISNNNFKMELNGPIISVNSPVCDFGTYSTLPTEAHDLLLYALLHKYNYSHPCPISLMYSLQVKEFTN